MKSQAILLSEIEKNIKRAEKAQKDAKRWETHNLLQSAHKQSEETMERTVVARDKPVVRIAVKHLMAAMKKYCPSEGVLANMLKGVVYASTHKRNYLQSLYDHVKTLSCLVEDCLEKPKGKYLILILANFSVLGRATVRLPNISERLYNIPYTAGSCK